LDIEPLGITHLLPLFEVTRQTLPSKYGIDAACNNEGELKLSAMTSVPSVEINTLFIKAYLGQSS
jgi:hypothetical protein